MATAIIPASTGRLLFGQWNWPQALRPARPERDGAHLAAEIDAARGRAIADGVLSVPPGMYRALVGFFPSDLLHKARFASVRRRLPRLPSGYGDRQAVTLGEVVLFRSDRLAQMAPRIWAHQLAHVAQCQRWGIDGFARRYVEDRAAVEREAIAIADRFAAWQTESAA